MNRAGAKIVTVVGARPQFVKASVVSAALRSLGTNPERVIHTGQHFDGNMSGVFFEELEMAPADYNLGIHGGSHGRMTGRMMEAIEEVLLAEKPGAVLVYGDTNSTLAAALAAAKLNIPIAHVESGLRSFNRRMPEEINRVLTDHLASWLFAPTEGAVRHLHAEGIAPAAVHQVGDVMYDAAIRYGRRADAKRSDLIEKLGVGGGPYALATIHRAENTDAAERLGVIVEAFTSIAPQLPVVWPVHPRTREVLQKRGLTRNLPTRLMLVEPQSYFGMVCLERGAAVIVTDSGGVQKEAFFHGVPCVTLRDETEWMELVELGWNRLVPPISAAAIRETVLAAVGHRGSEGTPYGDGHAAGRIADLLAAGLA